MSPCRDCESYVRRVTQLEVELKESQEDRNFVKTLWRQVQSEHADIGLIVNTVLDRVAQQNEDKDNNILQILQDKDAHIASLAQEVSWLSGSLEQEREEAVRLKKEWEEKQDDLNELISELEEQIAVKNLQIFDPAKQEREVLAEKLDQKKSSLEKQLLNMRTDLKSCVSQMDSLKRRHEEQVEENCNLRNVLESKHVETESHKLIISELKENLAQRKEESGLLRQQLQLTEADAAGALRALEKSDKALRDTEQEGLVREQTAHQKEEKHRSSLELLHNTIAQLEERVTELVKQEQDIREECLKLKRAGCEGCSELKAALQSKERELREGEKSVELLSLVRDKCASYLTRPLASQDIPDVVDIILGDVAACNEDLERSSKLIKQLQINCQEKSVGLAKLQEVHDNRLERMSNLQEHLSEVLDEVKALDKDRWKDLSCDFRELHHNPQPLRHEDSSTVWADLAHYKTGCSKLKRELDRRQEELDQLKLQRVLDINTFNEMKAAVLADQQECERKLRVANHQSICGCNLQLEIHRDKIEELSERTEGLNSENIKLISALKAAQSKVSTLEDCVCDFEDSATQTSVKTTSSVGTVTDNIIQLKDNSNNDNFSNTLTLLNKLTVGNHGNTVEQYNTVANQENIAPSCPPKTTARNKTTKRAVCTKTIGCQTITRPPVKVLQKAPAALKIRLASLNQQVAVLTKAKNRHSKEMAEEAGKVERLETQLSTALRQLSSSQHLVTGLNEDVRAANQETQNLRDQMQEIERSGLRQSELAILQEKTAEIRKLNHHNNLLSSQISKMNSNLSDMEKEAEDKSLKVAKLEEKLLRSEKLVKQQRSDNDLIRQELATVRSSTQQHSNKTEELAKRLKKIQEVSDNRKNYIDTLKSQLSNAKINLEQATGRSAESKAELDNKTRELRSLTRKLDGQDKLISDVQVMASRQLEDQGREFCTVENVLNKKLTVLSKRNLEWEKCIRQAIGKIVDKIKQEKDRRTVASSLSSVEYDRAKHLSSSLLQLSEADFHDIMSSTKVNNTSSSDSAEVWKGQLAKILCLDDFGPVLANSLFQLFQEYAKVLSGDNSESSILTGNSRSLTHSSELNSSYHGSSDHTPVTLN